MWDHRLRGDALEPERSAERSLPNGTTFVYQRSPLPDGGFVATYTDITERKRAEQEAAEQSHLLGATFENMAQGFAVYDADMRLIAFNQRLVDLRGYPSDLVRIGMNYEDLVRFNADQDGLIHMKAVD